MTAQAATEKKKPKKRGPKPGTVMNRMRPYQKNAIRLFQEQAITGVFKPVEQTLLEAGYAPRSARQISNVMIGIRPHVEPVVQRMEDHRERVLDLMEKKAAGATYGELARSLDITTRNIRLLKGQSTENNLSLSLDVRAKLESIIDE